MVNLSQLQEQVHLLHPDTRCHLVPPNRVSTRYSTENHEGTGHKHHLPVLFPGHWWGTSVGGPGCLYDRYLISLDLTDHLFSTTIVKMADITDPDTKLGERKETFQRGPLL